MQRKKFFLIMLVCFLLLGSALLAKRQFAKAKTIASSNKNIELKKSQQPDNVSVQTATASDSNSDSVAQVSQASVVNTQAQGSAPTYPVHKNISVTYFWAGEPADGDNKHISNVPSAWDDDWEKHFGGVDDPDKRSGFVVADFVPKENSFYFALPYNDFGDNGKRKKEAYNLVPWANSKQWGTTESMLKNQWIQITKNGKTAYAQWEDVGPFGEDDGNYVFGSAAPSSKTNERAGLDVSPSVKDFLGLGDIDKVDWQFVSPDQVPDGPWKKTVTVSQIYWK